MFEGSLFAQDFLNDTVKNLEVWESLTSGYDKFKAEVKTLFKTFPYENNPIEAQTEDDLIWQILDLLGWTQSLRQQNLSPKGRKDIPDGLLFLKKSKKKKANKTEEQYKSYKHGICLVESKRWNRPLDRRTGLKTDSGTPSTQMLRYLDRADIVSDRKLRWGILTNGRLWRLYWQGAKSRANDYFEVDIGAAFGLKGLGDTQPKIKGEKADHMLRVFYFIFQRGAFKKTGTDNRTLHERALEEAKLYEERVAEDLSGKIFNTVFPALASAIADNAKDAPLEDVRDASLILLYRLLFILYAEDRDLLPVHDDRYDDYALRARVRNDVKRRKDEEDAFSDKASRYWNHFSDLCRAIDKGDKSIGIPPYNGGLFNTEKHQLLDGIKLPDTIMADLIDAMCFEQDDNGERRYINYRDLSVQQLGSIYERLLEFDVVEDGGSVSLRPNIFARKGSGSYYTPDDLVSLIIDETLNPLIKRAYNNFEEGGVDIAAAILELTICDPAMGSGHFLVSLVDYLADKVITAIAYVEDENYSSPIVQRIEKIRSKILQNAKKKHWTVKEEQLDDKNIIRRMILKRCVFGVDKNPMAVELAKVALWLHTFTVGAPLSFLDHHLKCGDSLFGAWVYDGVNDAELLGGALLAHPLTSKASQAEKIMELVEQLPDTEISEVEQSKSLYEDVLEAIQPLNRMLSVTHALKWLNLKGADKGIIGAFFGDHFGRTDDILLWGAQPNYKKKDGARFKEIWHDLNKLIDEERFFHWQVSFPGIWNRWKSPVLHGGFDAVIGNPPWDRIKLQQVEWFAARKPEVAMLPRASDRKKAIKKLVADGDKLGMDFEKADLRARQQLDVARRKANKGGNYPWLGRGDINLYALFVERAQQLIKPDGMMGLLVPSGIASDKTSAPFFKSVATEGRLKALYDFENKKIFFKDVHASFKFCIFVAGKQSLGQDANCAFYLHSVDGINDPERCFPLSAEDFARINPNTGTAPIFRSRRDAQLTRGIYERLPILVRHEGNEKHKTWPVKYTTMFHMTNDSHLFRTKDELERQEKAWSIGMGKWESKAGEWVPLYEGKMVQAYDHRAANIIINKSNLNRPAQQIPTTLVEHKNPNWFPSIQYWVKAAEVITCDNDEYMLGFKEITATTNARTFICSLFPKVGFGNKVPIFKSEIKSDLYALCANINSLALDFVCRQKVQGQTLNLFIVEQLPIVPPETYTTKKFGSKTVGEIVRAAVLELTYTAHDMAPFAKDMGYVKKNGDVRAPFKWNEERRLYLRAKLDALYFILYGITDADDVAYIYSTFPIVERKETNEYGRYQSRDLCLMWINALQAGKPDAEIKL